MNIKNQNLLWKIVLIIALAILIVSCQPTATATQSTSNNEIQDIHVQITEPATKATDRVEEIPLDNCKGTGILEQSIAKFSSISKSATVGTKATLTGGGEVAIPETTKLKLEIQVELAAQQSLVSVNSRLDTINMTAGPNSYVVYEIAWEEQTFSSIVQYSSGGNVYEVPYTYTISVPKLAGPGPDHDCKMEQIYSTLQLGLLPLDKESYTSGEKIFFSVKLTNLSNETLVIPENNQYGQTYYFVGIIQTYIERLGTDKTIPGMGTSFDGTRYASGGGTVLPGVNMVKPSESVSFRPDLDTNGFPAGMYRFYVDYEKQDGSVIKTVTVDFEVR